MSFHRLLAITRDNYRLLDFEENEEKKKTKIKFMLEIMAVINGENSSYSKIGFKSELLFGFSNATNHNGERKEFHSF